MKTFLAVLGGIFVVLIIIIVAALSHFAGGEFDPESKAYVDSKLPDIIANWDTEELLDAASPELLKAVSVEDIEQLFDKYSRRLGPLVRYEGCEGKRMNMSLKTQSGKAAAAVYTAEATFEKGPATILFMVIKHEDSWQVFQFSVSPKSDTSLN